MIGDRTVSVIFFFFFFSAPASPLSLYSASACRVNVRNRFLDRRCDKTSSDLTDWMHSNATSDRLDADKSEMQTADNFHEVTRILLGARNWGWGCLFAQVTEKVLIKCFKNENIGH